MAKNHRYLIPIAEASIAWGLNRERLIRAIASGSIHGEQRFGRWLVDSRGAGIARQLAASPRSSTRPLKPAVATKKAKAGQ
jgi:hypothetical protein